VLAALSIFLLGPLVAAFPAAAPAFPWTLWASPVTAIGGSIAGVDVLRAPPLYDLVPIASEMPFAYPPAHGPLAVAGAACVCGLLADRIAGRLARRATPTADRA
jgi:hypothetical protein